MGNDIVYKICKDDELKAYVEGDKIIYLSGNAKLLAPIPNSFFKKIYVTPKKISQDFWDEHSISCIGLATHSNGYYHLREKTGFYDFLIVQKGFLQVKFDNKKLDVPKGSCILIPPSKLVRSYVCSDTDVIWMHFKDVLYWSSILGCEVLIKKLSSFEKIVDLINVFYKEVYSESSPELLNLVAKSLVYVIRRELNGIKNSRKSKIEKLAQKIIKNPELNWNAQKCAQELNISIYNLNSSFLAKYGKKFFPFVVLERMNTAKKYIESGNFSNSEIAEKTGYANAYSFSKAFSAHFGKSPRDFKKSF